MRPEDVAECRAYSGATPSEALLNGFKISSESYTATLKGEPIMIFGVVPVEEMAAAIWLLSTPEIEDVSLTFLRESRRIISDFHDRWPVLFNYVDARNEVHLKWLRWIGFVFIARHPEFGIEKREFIEFIKIEKD